VNEGDCNDKSNSIYPEAEEVCGDGVDQDCSGDDLDCQASGTCSQSQRFSKVSSTGECLSDSSLNWSCVMDNHNRLVSRQLTSVG
jgi:hypothetical protein